MEGFKKSMNMFLVNDVLQYLRPKKVADLGQIKNRTMRVLTKLYRTAFRSPDDIKGMVERFMYDIFKAKTDHYRDGSIVVKLKTIVEGLHYARNEFFKDYEEHFKNYSEFKGWLTPMEIHTASANVMKIVIQELIERHNDLVREIFEKTGIDIPEVSVNDYMLYDRKIDSYDPNYYKSVGLAARNGVLLFDGIGNTPNTRGGKTHSNNIKGPLMDMKVEWARK